MRTNIAAWEDAFEVLGEDWIDRHQIFEMAVDGAILHHPDLAIALDDLSLDLAGFFVAENIDRKFAVDDFLSDFGHAFRAKRVGGSRPPERRFLLLPGFEKRLFRPLGRE